MADTRQCGRCAREQPACRGALRGFVLRRGGLAGFVAGLGRLVARAGPMAAGLKHQDDPDCQQHQQDESQERDRVQQGRSARVFGQVTVLDRTPLRSAGVPVVEER